MLYINKYSTYLSYNWKAVLTAFIQLPLPLTPLVTTNLISCSMRLFLKYN